MSKQKIKPIKAWLVIEEGNVIPYQFSYSGHVQFPVFPDKRSALYWIGAKEHKIIKVIITPLGDKKKCVK